MDAMNDATAAGRGYGVAGGVASAIEDVSKSIILTQRFISNMLRVSLSARRF